jgi:hypothetical protein
LQFENKTNFDLKIKLINKENNKFEIFELKSKKLIGIPFEYFSGFIEILDNNNFSSEKYKILEFFSPQEILVEFNLDGIYCHFYHKKGELFYNKIIQIRNFYVIRNCLPFDMNFSYKKSKNGFSENICLKKGEKFYCNNISMNNDFEAKINFLNFSLNKNKSIILYEKNPKKKNKTNTNEIIFYDNKNNNCNNKKNFVSVLITILKKKKITIIIHPKTMLINHTNFTIEFYYGKINLKNPKKK